MLTSLYRLTLVALFTTAIVIMLGAFTRLTDAGLGCPDWPGCYGFLSVPTAEAEIQKAEQAFPDRPVEAHKAWNEMIHRYVAGTLGLLIFAIFMVCQKLKVFRGLSAILLVVVTGQAVLGMLTVTMNLMPLVVMAHLLGGFTTFCLLFILAIRIRKQVYPGWLETINFSTTKGLNRLTQGAIAAVVLQIALGGWTAANYAAVACLDLPICEAGWQQRFDLGQALSVPTGHETYEYGVFPFEARMSIHVLHRLGAFLVLFVVGALIVKLWRQRSPANQTAAFVLSVLLFSQIALGVSNVVFHLPLMVAVLHNFVAVCLLLSLLGVAYLSHFKQIRPTLQDTNSVDCEPNLVRGVSS